MSKKIQKLFFIFLSLTIFVENSFSKSNDLPSWFIKPRANNIDMIYGVAEGFTLEEATKSALADAAGRLMVSISSESELVKEENQNSYNEEMRQKVRQSIEKISFSGYQVSKSEQVDKKFYVEVSIEKDPFVNEQRERVEFVQKKINDLDKNSLQANPIQRRTSLIKILDLCKELDLKARILAGAQEEIDMKAILSLIAKYQNEFEKSSSTIEFFFDSSSPKDLVQILRSALNKEKLKIAKNLDKSDPNQIVIGAKYDSNHNFIYGSHITKLNIDFENFSQGKIVASNNIEVTGNSTIGESESIKAGIKALEEQIQKEGILKILGILN